MVRVWSSSLAGGKDVPVNWRVNSCFCGKGSGSFSHSGVNGEIMK